MSGAHRRIGAALAVPVLLILAMLGGAARLAGGAAATAPGHVTVLAARPDAQSVPAHRPGIRHPRPAATAAATRLPVVALPVAGLAAVFVLFGSAPRRRSFPGSASGRRPAARAPPVLAA